MTENDLAIVKDNSEVVDAITVQSNNDQSNSTSIPKHHVIFPNLTNDSDIKRDSEFLDKMHQIMTNGNTSTLLIPYLSQFRATYQKVRRSVKKRIESKAPESQLKKLIHIILSRYPQKVKLKQSHRLIHYQMKLSVLTLKTMKSQKLISIGK